MAGPARTAALVLAGAVVKGAFEAGALEVIASRGIAVRRIVASSSGALNGTAFAAGVRGRRTLDAARNLVKVWEEDASLAGAISPSLRAILRRRGISDQRKLLALLRRNVKPVTAADVAPIELLITVGALHGRQGRIDGEPATTYSEILSFPGAYFDEAETLERVFLAATASAALPILFAPVDVPGVGPCTDGGLVNNTPIQAAIRDDAHEIDAILVITPTPSLVEAPIAEHRGIELLAHQLDMVFAEWLYQDLGRGIRLHEGLRRLDALAARNGWGPAVVAEIRSALGFSDAHDVPIASIRPLSTLPGSIFSGFTDPAVRKEYVAIGRERAGRVLDELGWR